MAYVFHIYCFKFCGLGISVGTASDYGLEGPGIKSWWGEILRCPDRPWDHPVSCTMGTGSFPGVWLGCAADHSPPSSATVMKENSYTSTHPLGYNQACNGNTLPFTASNLNNHEELA